MTLLQLMKRGFQRLFLILAPSLNLDEARRASSPPGTFHTTGTTPAPFPPSLPQFHILFSPILLILFILLILLELSGKPSLA